MAMTHTETQKQQKPAAGTVQFWTMLGPLLIIGALITSLVKETSGYYLVIPIIGLIGIPLCWRWKMTGLTASLLMLFMGLAVVYGRLPIEDRFWEVGMAMAFALGFVITTLSLEEAETIVDTIQVESHSRLQNLWRLDERLRQSRANWEEEYYKVVDELQAQTREGGEKEARINSYEKMMGLARRDLDQAQAQQEKLAGKLQEKQEELRNLSEGQPEDEKLRHRIRELKDELKVTRSQDPHWSELQRTRGMCQQLRGQFEEKSQVLDQTRQKLFQAREQYLVLQKEMEEQQLQEQHMQEIPNERPDPSHQNTHQDTQAEVQILQELVTELTNQLADVGR